MFIGEFERSKLNQGTNGGKGKEGIIFSKEKSLVHTEYGAYDWGVKKEDWEGAGGFKFVFMIMF